MRLALAILPVLGLAVASPALAQDVPAPDWFLELQPRSAWPDAVSMLREGGYSVTEAGIADANPEDGLPSPIYRAAPDYPRAASRRGIQAACAVTLDITAEGATQNACAVCALSPDPDDAEIERAMAGAAVQAVAGWRYTQGEPLAGHSTPVVFGLPDAPATPDAPEPIACTAEPTE